MRERVGGTAVAKPASVAPPMAPLVIHDDVVFDLPSLRQALSLRGRTLPREIRAGRLTAYKRAGRYFVFGRDVKAWLRGGTVKGRTSEG